MKQLSIITQRDTQHGFHIYDKRLYLMLILIICGINFVCPLGSPGVSRPASGIGPRAWNPSIGSPAHYLCAIWSPNPWNRAKKLKLKRPYLGNWPSGKIRNSIWVNATIAAHPWALNTQYPSLNERPPSRTNLRHGAANLTRNNVSSV